MKSRYQISHSASNRIVDIIKLRSYSGGTLDDISTGVFARLQSKQLASALSSAELLLLSQFLITLAKNS